MTSKTQLQNKIQELEAELQSFKSQLNNYKVPTLQEASVGDTLEDGSIVLSKENGLALLIAPKSTEVACKWSQDFPEVYAKLKNEGFNPSQWFVPTKEQLKLAYVRLTNEFSSTIYWSSSEVSSAGACTQYFRFGSFFISGSKADSYRVRAFRCVTY